ncbi:helix-turn-helix domain-containing protein [Cohnella boryungensis]|uniref:Helix-turn-helix domain-containing protein n=1 Tax=Cohnella boryungensis TaxID=768479 RepID=A0ABV8SA40_9BACL
MLQEIESGHSGIKGAIRKYGLNKSTLAQWRRRYQLYGYEGLETCTHNRSYSEELKYQAVTQSTTLFSMISHCLQYGHLLLLVHLRLVPQYLTIW